MSTEAEIRLMKRRRGTVLKSVRQGHEQQMHRMDDFDVWSMMQDLGMQMGRKAVLTMLQDLCVLGYIQYTQTFDEENARARLSEIVLTSQGAAITIRRQSNDEVLFD